MQTGHIAEVLGGAPYEDLIHEKIFNNLNMTTATFMSELDKTENRAKPYEIMNQAFVRLDERAYRYVISMSLT